MNKLYCEPYVNQADVDRVRKMVDAISPGLKLSRYSFKWGANIVTDVGITLPVKGNKALIEKFVSVGFKRGHKYKREAGRAWNMYEGYSFLIELVFRLPEPPKEEA